MSDLPQPTTPTPTPAQPAQPPTPAAGQQGGQPITPPAQAAPQAPGQQPAAEAQPQQPYRAFASQEELDNFVKSAKSQAERAGVRKLAKDMGFEDADEMRETLQALRQAQGGGNPPAQPGAAVPPATAAPTPASNDGTRLQMAVQVGAKLNLPAALIARLQGGSVEEMEADAQNLLALMGSGAPRPPGIPPVPAGSQPVTFTATQLKDAEFVRQNAAAIQQAAKEGRIVRS